mmetsp:Transcript_7718/g.10581  ORF Transcript_7718/g.10581 Transcript_7718/m.10581 type:complete len:84 (-) Transcript_7718:414-665(-)
MPNDWIAGSSLSVGTSCRKNTWRSRPGKIAGCLLLEEIGLEKEDGWTQSKQISQEMQDEQESVQHNSGQDSSQAGKRLVTLHG